VDPRVKPEGGSTKLESSKNLAFLDGW